MRGMELPKDRSEFWQNFIKVQHLLRTPTHIDFCACPTSVVHAVADRHSHLEGITALSLTDDNRLAKLYKPFLFKNVQIAFYITFIFIFHL